MGSILMRIPLGHGASGEQQFMVAEVDPVDVEGVELAADHGMGGRLLSTSRSLAEAFDGLEPALGMIVTRLREAARGPDEIKVDFGLKLGGETGLIFAKGTAEATLNVSVTWSRQPPAGQGPVEQENAS